MRQTSLPLENLQAWSRLNNVQLFDVALEPHITADNGDDHGGGMLAKADRAETEPLVAVPLELVLSKERVEEAAKVDTGLRQLVDAAPTLFQVNQPPPDTLIVCDFLQNDRTAVLLFLVYQMTINSPDNSDHAPGFNNPLADYVKFLPKDIPLPIFYTADERELLVGTSLAEALDQKLISLQREFDSLKAATESITWCQQAWWDEITGCLDFADWKLADAVYRSRALELPRGASVGMVPVVDMANHASDDRYNARFEVDEDAGSVLLVVRDGKSIKQGDEVTIMYGCGGACEMIFSYGFLEEHASSAREMFLALSIPADDPLKMAKIRVAQTAPGVRIYVDEADQVQWDSTFVWWACINQEDGLDFRVEQTVDGDTELKALWKENELDPSALQAKLLQDDLRDVFVLRATVRLQQRVEEQGMRLAASEDDFDNALPGNAQIRPYVYETVGRLRKLEMDLLTRTYETLEEQKNQLLESPVVRAYLGQDRSGTDVPDSPDDFS